MNALPPPVGNEARATSEITDTDVLGRACMCTASQDTPTKSEIAITPITVSVFAALRPCGARNALTPFEIDSTPVRAAAPDEKARRRTRTPTPPAVPAVIGSGTCAWGHVPAAQRARPVAIMADI